MEATKGYVSQQNLLTPNDGSEWPVRLNRRAEIITPDPILQFAMEGRVYEVSNPTKGTAVAAGGTSYSDTAPAFLVDVPVGTSIVPLEILLKQGGTVAGAVITVLLTADNKLRYSSGGTAQTVRNNRTDAPFSSACSAYSGASAITAAAAGVARTFWASMLSPDVSPTADVEFPGFSNCVEWSIRDKVPPVLVGPASLVIYAYAGTTQASWFYTIKWLELPSAAVV